MSAGSRGVSCWPRGQGMEEESQWPLGQFQGTVQTGQDGIYDKNFARYPKLIQFFFIYHCFYALSIIIRKTLNTRRTQVLILRE